MTENEIKKEKKDIKDIFLNITVGTLFGLVWITIAGSLVYSWIEKRVTLVELKQRDIIEQKANKDDIKIIELSVKNINNNLEEIKRDIKEIKK